MYQARVLALISALLLNIGQSSVSASTHELEVADDKLTGYMRSAFKHWVDADRDGCNTRAEVLIEEAVVKPVIGPKCKLTGGEWISTYDGKSITDAAQLDVDHVVPLAEAWRSGAWKWTASKRQAFANDLANPEVLVAVTRTSNRSKGDKDPAIWMPAKSQCTYIQNWIGIKKRYSLTFDLNESNVIGAILSKCAQAKI